MSLISEVNKESSIMNNPNFRRWFGNSKVVDSSGNPLVVWKGMPINDDDGKPITIIKRKEEFPAFNHGEKGVQIAGFFTADPKVAKYFSMVFRSSQVIAVYLKIEHPFIIDMNKWDKEQRKSGFAQFGSTGLEFRNAIRSGKYDGVFILNTEDEGDVYVPLTPNQIKSVNSIGFDIDNPEFQKENL